MALVPCPTCNKSISSHAPVCPKCRAELSKSLNDTYPWPNRDRSEQSGSPATPAALDPRQQIERFQENKRALHAIFDSRLGPFANQPDVQQNYVPGFLTLVRSFFGWEQGKQNEQIYQFHSSLGSRASASRDRGEILPALQKLSLQAAKSGVSIVEIKLAACFVRDNSIVESKLVLCTPSYTDTCSTLRQSLMRNAGQTEQILFPHNQNTTG